MPDGYVAFVLFVIVMTGTPGAGNLSMMAIGQSRGFKAALPFLAGTTVGMVALNSLVGFGLGGLLLASPQAAWGLRAAGMAYILYLAWKIVTMRVGPAGNADRLTFVHGVFLHPTNPKSWAMSVVGFSQLAGTGWPFSVRLAVFALTFLLFQVSAHSLWGLAGASLMRAFSSPRASRVVTGFLAVSMVGATAYALFL